MSKIIVYQGVQCSGKTQAAKKFVKENPNYVRVSRDDIRLARGTYWIPEQESYINDVEEFQVITAIKRGLNVVIDAMNLNPKTIAKWKNLANELRCDIEFKLFEIEYAEALKRLKERNKTSEIVIKTDVLYQTFKKYFPEKLIDQQFMLAPNDNLPKCVICDIDGVIAKNLSGRSPYDYSKVGNDTCDKRLLNLLKVIYEGHYSNPEGTKKSSPEIIFFSGREKTQECWDNTLAWLNKHIGNQFDWDLYMRAEHDSRKDNIVKRELYEEIIKDKYDVLCVLDDRDSVVKMWRELGLLTCQVYYGDF